MEEVSTSKVLSKEDQYCEDYFADTVYRDSRGRFVVRLPFSERLAEVSFAHTRQIAVACLLRSEKHRAQDSRVDCAYRKFMDEYLTLGHMESVNSNHRRNNTFYFTHHAVHSAEVGPEGKFRVVFNGSFGKTSLNDVLLTGRKLQSDVSIIISMWRFSGVVFTADIVKEFRQILIHPDDVDWQRIVWRSDPSKPIEDFRLLTVTYGTRSAPYLSIRTLLQLAQEGCEEHPLASRVLRHNMYVDDAFVGADSEADAITIRDQLIKLLSSAGMDLGKWASNRPAVVEDIQVEKHKEFSVKWDETVSTLGLKWTPSVDSFHFEVNIPLSPKVITKRAILSEVAKLFDPLGWLAPVLIRAKLMLQDLWINHVDWDTPLTGELLEQWQTLRSELPQLATLSIPRWFGTSSQTVWEFHGFSDASQRAFVATAYVVIPGVKSALIMSKTKVAPIKTESLPRLELCGSVLLVRLLKHLLDGMMLKPVSVHCWTDSKVVLDWLTGHPSRWQTFVANRVSEVITTLPGVQWRHVRSEDNPADCATRGFSPEQLQHSSLWWEGPEWIRKDWRTATAPLSTSSTRDVVTAQVALEEKIEEAQESQPLSSLERFSSFPKMLRILSCCYRWRSNAAKPKGSRSDGHFTTEEIEAARVGLLRFIQSQHFKEDLRCLNGDKRLSSRSQLLRLVPFICSQGLLRVGGRLQHSFLQYDERHPIILPSSSIFVKRLIEEVHRQTLHGGVQLMLSSLNRTYWITRGLRVVQGVFRRCYRCIRYAAQSVQQQMAPLPAYRVAPQRVFAYTGLDFAGPFPILFSRGRGAKSTKGYIAIFVCMVVRAVHIEVVSDLSSVAFLAAFRRFTARRGLCKMVFSDNGTNFKGAATEIDKLFQQASSVSQEVAAALAKDGVIWSFIPPRAPHFGGLWEAAVKSFKHHFKRVIGDTTLTFEEMATVSAQIEACLNSRPLCPLSSEPTDTVALTPGHFLINAPLNVLPEPFIDTNFNSRTCRWNHLSAMRNHFWDRWRQEVLHHVQQRNKWLTPGRQLGVGDLVLLKDDLCPPSKWPMGRVTAVHPGKDGLVRVVTIRTAASEFQRPVVKVVYLPTDEGLEKAASCRQPDTSQPRGSAA